ncbi:hypothetical protein EYF80_050369 [Liparis tanakae]|uniref:Uncharacterized protein n=1 Tax=Liparis tanakae TaxID=230148 RepID=A0A4Z2FFE9_9TELE|nr:hypothetical protein EYF80_050369 [Liparis tanakae]
MEPRPKSGVTTKFHKGPETSGSPNPHLLEVIDERWYPFESEKHGAARKSHEWRRKEDEEEDKRMSLSGLRFWGAAERGRAKGKQNGHLISASAPDTHNFIVAVITPLPTRGC